MSGAGVAAPPTQTLRLASAIELDSGASLRPIQVAYRTWGRLNRTGDNAVLVCHALTGSADADLWWAGMLGPGRSLDPEHDFIICSNVLGSCYGSTGPASVDPLSGERYGPGFPPVTVRDMVRLQASLLDHLGVARLRLVIGGSLGGMQALEWALTFPERVDAVTAIGACGRHSAWAIALGAAQRAAIRSDPRFAGGHYGTDDPPSQGLALARMIAMCSYRSPSSFGGRFGRTLGAGGSFEVESYLRHHGGKLVARFDANCYLTLAAAMDSHDLGRDRGPYEAVLAAIRQPVLVIGIDSDVLYPPEEQRELASQIPAAELAWLPSPHGHDAFLIETAALGELVRGFRERCAAGYHRLAS